MNATIIFGSKKLGQTQEKASNEKYPDLAVLTVEGVKGAKKSRRILLNTKAAELLSLESGSVQEIIFASVEMNNSADRKVLIANKSVMPEDSGDMTVYKTSKNKVAYGEDTSERGKAITSSHMCSEIFSFLGQDDSANIEFELGAFDSDQIEAFALNTVGSSANVEQIEVESATTLSSEEVIEANNGSYTGDELVDSIRDQVARDEANDPIFNTTEEVVEEETAVSDWA